MSHQAPYSHPHRQHSYTNVYGYCSIVKVQMCNPKQNGTDRLHARQRKRVIAALEVRADRGKSLIIRPVKSHATVLEPETVTKVLRIVLSFPPTHVAGLYIKMANLPNKNTLILSGVLLNSGKPDATGLKHAADTVMLIVYPQPTQGFRIGCLHGSRGRNRHIWLAAPPCIGIKVLSACRRDRKCLGVQCIDANPASIALAILIDSYPCQLLAY